MTESRTLQFESPRALQSLYANDIKLLKHLEDSLGVKVTTREGWMKLEGDPSRVDKAQQVFQQLEQARQQGVDIQKHEFNYTLKAVTEERDEIRDPAVIDVRVGAIESPEMGVRRPRARHVLMHEHLQVDSDRVERVAGLVLDSGASTGDYPRGYAVTVSLDGTTWSAPVATGGGTGQITSIALDRRPVRYLRVTLTASVGNWWSVADVRAYVPGLPHSYSD